MAAITSAAIGVAATGYSIYQGEQQKKKAKQELNQYERQDLVNAAENIEISTIGSDLMRDETRLAVANMVDALQGGGARALGASLPQLQAGINQTNRQIQKDLDDQVIRREYAIANEESQLRGIRENRDNQNIAALSSQYMAGEQNVWNGINGAVAAVGSLGRTINDTASYQSQPNTDYARPVANSLSGSIVPRGGTYYNPFESITPFTLPAVNTLFTERKMYNEEDF